MDRGPKMYHRLGRPGKYRKSINTDAFTSWSRINRLVKCLSSKMSNCEALWMKSTRKSAQAPPVGSLWAHETRMLSILCFVRFLNHTKEKR